MKATKSVTGEKLNKQTKKIKPIKMIPVSIKYAKQ